MNYAVKTDRICTAGVIFSDTSEQTVDADLALPDYCPDIQRILKCRIEPQIDSKNIAGDRLEISGTSFVRVIYIDAIKNSVRCTEQCYPFEISANLPTSPQSAVIMTDIRVSYLNCRALSPRRLNIHGAFTVGVKVTDKTETRVCTHIKGEDIQQRKRAVNYSSLEALTQQQFSVTEALETGQNGAAVQSVIRCDIRVVSKESTMNSGKLMYKGELLVKLLYLSDLDTGKTETLEYDIPFSQVIGMQNAAEGSELAVRAEVMNSSVVLKSEIGFDDPLPVLSARVCVTVLSLKKRETTLVTDCYSTMYKTKTETAKTELPLLCAVLSESIVEKSNVDLTDSSITKVLDVWCEKGAVVCDSVNGKALLRGKYTVCVLAEDTEGSALYTERTMEYSRDVRAVAEGARLDPYISCEAVSTSFRFVNEKRIEVRTELLVTGELYELTAISGIVSAQGDDTAPNTHSTDASLILYYAQKGEDIWEIARDYATSAELVRLENDLTEDVLKEDMMIMLPV